MKITRDGKGYDLRSAVDATVSNAVGYYDGKVEALERKVEELTRIVSILVDVQFGDGYRPLPIKRVEEILGYGFNVEKD